MLSRPDIALTGAVAAVVTSSRSLPSALASATDRDDQQRQRRLYGGGHRHGRGNYWGGPPPGWLGGYGPGEPLGWGRPPPGWWSSSSSSSSGSSSKASKRSKSGRRSKSSKARKGSSNSSHGGWNGVWDDLYHQKPTDGGGYERSPHWNGHGGNVDDGWDDGGWVDSWSSSSNSSTGKSGKGSKGSSSSWGGSDYDDWAHGGWSESSSSGKPGKGGIKSGDGSEKSSKSSSSSIVWSGDGWADGGWEGGSSTSRDSGEDGRPCPGVAIPRIDGWSGAPGWDGDGWEGDGYYRADIAHLRSDIARLIRKSDRELIPKFLRLGFHDCVGGCDGCVDLDNADNKGLKEPIDAIYPIVRRYRDSYSRADVWALSTLIAADLALVSDHRPRDINFPMRYIGRKDCDGASARGVGGPDVTMPHGDYTTHELLRFFKEVFGFDAREAVVIMGAHAVAVAHRGNGGYGNPDRRDGWVFGADSFELDNRYYSMLAGEGAAWRAELARNGDGAPVRYQWFHERDGEDERPIMTNSDMALVRDLEGYLGADEDGNRGKAECVFGDVAGDHGGRRRRRPPRKRAVCPVASETMELVLEYMSDEVGWLYDFEEALEKMVMNGYDPDIPGLVGERQ